MGFSFPDGDLYTEADACLRLPVVLVSLEASEVLRRLGDSNHLGAVLEASHVVLRADARVGVEVAAVVAGGRDVGRDAVTRRTRIKVELVRAPLAADDSNNGEKSKKAECGS